MKNRKARLSLLVVVLAMTAQLSLISPSIRAQNANSSTTADTGTQNDNGPSIPTSPCRRKCFISYRQCLRSKVNLKTCRVRLRVCLRRCPQ
ncbi:MAG: hypothetical protein QOJ64_4308 [Acidobacteriota bacterium]|nr:hypothetical protein [Acidobacteriota bacterium]